MFVLFLFFVVIVVLLLCFFCGELFFFCSLSLFVVCLGVVTISWVSRVLLFQLNDSFILVSTDALGRAEQTEREFAEYRGSHEGKRTYNH